MLRKVGRVLFYEAKDLKSKTIFAKARASKVREGVDPRDIDDDAVAKECGLIRPDAVSKHELLKEKEHLLAALKQQKLRRIARREAFLEWQAGQREKGAAHRLERQSKTAEKFKRRHYHSRKGRILSIGYMDEVGYCSNDNEPWGQINRPLLKSAERESFSEFLVNPGGERATAVFLSLRKR